MKLRTFAIAFVAIAAIGCTGRRDIISENIHNAEIQLGHLLEASEAGDTLRIPSTYKDGEIQFVPTDDWVSGFFAGTLWYMYELTGDEKWAEHARRHTEILHDIQYLKWHHDVGFMVYDSYGNGLRLKHLPGYDTVLVNTARSLSTRFRPKAGILQSWNVVNNGWQSLRGWKCPVIIDNMMNLELLFQASKLTGDNKYKDIAIRHADKTMACHFRPDMTSYHVVSYNPDGSIETRQTFQGRSDESAWARGQAWGVYGYTVCYRETGDKKYLEFAQKIADMIISRVKTEDHIPLWDYDAPNLPTTPRDASAAAVTSSALFELCGYLPDSQKYFDYAESILRSLSSPEYLAEPGTNCGFILKHSTGSLAHGSEIDVPLNYADYYYLESIKRYMGE